MSSRSMAAVVAAACALSLAACSSNSTDSKDSKDSGKSATSSSSKSTPPPAAKDVWNKTQDTLGTYKSLDLKFDGEFNKMTDMDVKGDVDGEPQQITGTTQGSKIGYLSTGGKTYIKADSAFWTKEGHLPASMTSQVADKWFVSPSSGSSMKGVLSGMIASLRNDTESKDLLDGKATITSDTLDGKDVWKLTGSDKKASAWVSKDERHDLLKVEGPNTMGPAGTRMSMTIVSHDKDYGLTAPADAKSMQDLTQ